MTTYEGYAQKRISNLAALLNPFESCFM